MKHTPLAQGFTLIELLIALACVALLASLAWPSYQSLILKSQRAQARASLLQAAHWFERAASANGSYPSAADVPASVLQIDGQRYKMTVISTAPIRLTGLWPGSAWHNPDDGRWLFAG